MSVSTQTIGWTRIGLLVASLMMAACMAKPIYLPVQEIPEDQPISYAEEKLSKRIYTNFNKRFQLSDNIERHEQLTRLVDHLSRSVGEHPGTWRVHLLEAPEIVDVRAVVGNRIFIWSGLYNVISNEDELAGLLAHEMAHVKNRDILIGSIAATMAGAIVSQAGTGGVGVTIALGGHYVREGGDWATIEVAISSWTAPETKMIRSFSMRE